MEDKSLIDVLVDISSYIAANGRKILEEPERFKSLFLDHSRNQHRAAAQIISQFLASTISATTLNGGTT